LYRLTWKERVTPLQRRICALRGSVLRISDSGCTLWPTPTATEHSVDNLVSAEKEARRKNWNNALHIAVYAT
jgi:hypothetical protein